MCRRAWCVSLLGSLAPSRSEDLGLNIPTFLWDQQRFHEKVSESRWSAQQMDYIDGATSEVLKNPYTLAFDEDGSLFVASFTHNHIVRMRMGPGKTAKWKIFASGTEMDSPVGMVVSGGQLFVASFTNDRILRVDTNNGQLIDTFGNEDQLDCPEGIALGPGGSHLYVASFLLKHIVRYELSSGAYLGQFSESGARPAASAAMLHPAAPQPAPPLNGAEDLAFDWDGNLHVTAYYSDAVHKYNGTTGAFMVAYGRGLVRGPVGIVCGPDSGDIFISSYKASQVLRFSSEGQFIGVAAGVDKGKRGKKVISSPTGLTFDPHDGTLWVASYVSSTVVRFNSSYGGGRTYWRVTV